MALVVRYVITRCLHHTTSTRTCAHLAPHACKQALRELHQSHRSPTTSKTALELDRAKYHARCMVDDLHQALRRDKAQRIEQPGSFRVQTFQLTEWQGSDDVDYGQSSPRSQNANHFTSDSSDSSPQSRLNHAQKGKKLGDGEGRVFSNQHDERKGQHSARESKNCSSSAFRQRLRILNGFRDRSRGRRDWTTLHQYLWLGAVQLENAIEIEIEEVDEYEAVVQHALPSGHTATSSPVSTKRTCRRQRVGVAEVERKSSSPPSQAPWPTSATLSAKA